MNTATYPLSAGRAHTAAPSVRFSDLTRCYVAATPQADMAAARYQLARLKELVDVLVGRRIDTLPLTQMLAGYSAKAAASAERHTAEAAAESLRTIISINIEIEKHLSELCVFMFAAGGGEPTDAEASPAPFDFTHL